MESCFPSDRKFSGKALRYVRIALTFCFCVLAWIFFVANSTDDAIYVISNCLTGISRPISYLYNGYTEIARRSEGPRYTLAILASIGICSIVLFIYDLISLKKPFIEWLAEKKSIIQWGFYLLIALLIVFLSRKGVAAEFIYFQF